LTFERYGAFTDRELTFRENANLHVVLGPNGAGKTSALCGVGDLLFGFGKRTEYDFLYEAKALRIGARLRLADGSPLAFRRRKGDKNTILDEADKPLSDDLLRPLLGAMKREAFFNEFGLTAKALREGGQDLLRAGGRLAETLAASSVQLSALSRVRMRLEKEADDLFGPRRSASKAFYAATDRFDQAEKRLREAIVTTDALKAAEHVVAEAQRRLDELHFKHDSIGRDLARRQRALRTRPRLVRIEALRSKLETHADLPPVGADVVQMWRSSLEEQNQTDFQLAEIDLVDAQNNTEIAQLDVDEALLAVGPRVDALREKLGAVRKAEEDLPKRNEALRLAREELTKCARRLGLASHEELLTGMPSDIDLVTVRDLIGGRKDAERRLAEAESGLETARSELQRLDQDIGAQRHAADPNPFSRRLDAFADVPGDADRLRREMAAHGAENRRLSEDAAKLDPPAGSPDEFARRPLPQASQIEAAHQLFAKISDEEKSVAEKIEAVRRTFTAIDEELKRLSKSGAVATKEDLAKARIRRDQEFATLGVRLDENPICGRESLEALGAANAAIDVTTDLLFSNADRASRFEAAHERLSKERVQQESLVSSQEEIESRRREAETAWLALWARSGINPHAPAIMARWLERTADILGRRRRLEDQKIEHEALARKLEEHRGALRRLLEDMGVVADAELPIEALYKVARAAVDHLQVSWAALRERTVLRAKAVEAVTNADATLARIREEVEGFRSSWPKALVAVGLFGDASIVQAEAALTIWQGVPLQKQIFEQEAHRIQTMQSDIVAFEHAVTALAREAAPDLTALPPREALDKISQRLLAARSARDQRETLRMAGEKRSASRGALATKRKLTVEVLKRAREVIGLTDDDNLSGAIKCLEQRNALAEELADVLRDLADIGDNHDELTLREEQRDLDFDILPGEIERLTLGQSELMADIAGAVTALHDAKKARDLLMVGRDAESAARDRAEASTELLTITDHWLARVAAACLATRAIERHRAAAQDPLVGRASMLFAIATAGAFAGLGAEYDEADTPELVGLRPDGGHVPVLGMSEGERDQLYLSLRLALLELRSSEPLPFIADDLLASFDEIRVARALELLAEFAHTRQVILFTHHRHVAEIARERLQMAVDIISI
jgi:uncharacterized protein YhaN